MLETKFRAASGVLRDRALFQETAKLSDEHVLYTLRDREDPEHPCIQDLYLQEMDLSEFNFACKYFHDFAHWKVIKDKAWFKDTYRNMREGLEAKIQCMAIQKMLDLVIEGKAGHQTLAYLANRNYLDKEKVGRPNKDAIEKQAKAELERKKIELEEINNLIEHNPKLKRLVPDGAKG